MFAVFILWNNTNNDTVCDDSDGDEDDDCVWDRCTSTFQPYKRKNGNPTHAPPYNNIFWNVLRPTFVFVIFVYHFRPRLRWYVCRVQFYKFIYIYHFVNFSRFPFDFTIFCKFFCCSSCIKRHFLSLTERKISDFQLHLYRSTFKIVPLEYVCVCESIAINPSPSKKIAFIYSSRLFCKQYWWRINLKNEWNNKNHDSERLVHKDKPIRIDKFNSK